MHSRGGERKVLVDGTAFAFVALADWSDTRPTVRKIGKIPRRFAVENSIIVDTGLYCFPSSAFSMDANLDRSP